MDCFLFRVKPIPGAGATETIFSVPLISDLVSIVKTRITSWIPRKYLTGVAVARLWLHLPIMNVIKKMKKKFFCKIEHFVTDKLPNGALETPTQEPVLIDCVMLPQELTSMEVKSKYINFQSRKWIWNCRLPTGRHLPRPQCVNSHMQYT